MKAKYLIVEWTDSPAMLFVLEHDQYVYYDQHGTPDSTLDDWDTSQATIHEVNV